MALHWWKFQRNRAARVDAPDIDSDALVGAMKDMRVSDSPQSVARRKQDKLMHDLGARRLPPRERALLEAVTLDAFVTRFSESKDPQRAYVYAHSVMMQRLRAQSRRGQPVRALVPTHIRRRRNFAG